VASANSADERIAALAGRAGLRRSGPVSLEKLEARRTQLWGVVFVVLVALGLIVAMISVGDERSFSSFLVSLPGFRVGIVLVLAGFGGYVLEQERNLRRLTGLLFDEQMSAAQHALVVAQLTDIDHLKSEFVSSVELELSAALRGVRDTAACLDPVNEAQERVLGMLHRGIDYAEDTLRERVALHDRVVLERSRPKNHDVIRSGPRP
jgi:signal transduction histidine kinase